MLVYVRPSNEALLRARVPGAQDQRGCHSIPFIVRVPRAGGRPGCPSHPFQGTHSGSAGDRSTPTIPSNAENLAEELMGMAGNESRRLIADGVPHKT